MGAIRIMVVDDSPFSRTLLADALQEEGYEVVGEASSLETLLEVYSTCKPDIVTMDIAMPGADGFECSKALRIHDPAAKIVLVSSMKDAETETEARRIGIMGYVQKPVESEALKRVIENVIAPDALFERLDMLSIESVKEALAQNMTRITKKNTMFIDQAAAEKQITSQGITVVIGIIGRYPGTMILDIAEDSVEKMVELILRRPPKDRTELLSSGAEFANVVAGVACSMLNKKDKTFGLRVAPPSLFYGVNTEIVSPQIRAKSFYADTDIGRIYMSIGFKKGTVLWM